MFQVLKGDLVPAIETHEMLYQVMQRHNFIPEVSLPFHYPQQANAGMDPVSSFQLYFNFFIGFRSKLGAFVICFLLVSTTIQ